METKKWERWTQSLTIFPSNKYQFSTYLKRVGDFIITHPLSKKERKQIVDAALFWAWHKKKRVTTRALRVAEDKWEVYIELVSQTYERDFG
jgi:hypothetical protein